MRTLLLLSLLFFTQATLAVKHQGHRMGVHGMAVFQIGEHFYAHHMGLFHTRHAYQLIYRIKAEQPFVLTDALSQSQLVSLVPDPFDLNRLVKRESFTLEGQVYEGHFERGGIQKERIKLHFVEPVFIRPIDIDSKASALSEWQLLPVTLDKKHTIYISALSPQFRLDAVLLSNKKSKKHAIVCAAQGLTPEKLTQCAIQHHLDAEIIYFETADFQGHAHSAPQQ